MKQSKSEEYRERAEATAAAAAQVERIGKPEIAAAYREIEAMWIHLAAQIVALDK